MALTLTTLFSEMNTAGLTLRRSPFGEVEIVGDTSRITDGIRTAVREHRGTILACLPESPASAPAAAPDLQQVHQEQRQAQQAADGIRRQLVEFGEWLRREAIWAQPQYLADIDRRVQAAVDAQHPPTVARQIESLRQEVEGINWAAEILPRSFEAEAKHAIEAGAGPAANSAPADDEAPF